MLPLTRTESPRMGLRQAKHRTGAGFAGGAARAARDAGVGARSRARQSQGRRKRAMTPTLYPWETRAGNRRVPARTKRRGFPGGDPGTPTPRGELAAPPGGDDVGQVAELSSLYRAG